jgi:hypothetical protein
MSVINILMQLRKVCNHPNLFDPRPIQSPFITKPIVFRTASLVQDVLEVSPLKVSVGRGPPGGRATRTRCLWTHWGDNPACLLGKESACLGFVCVPSKGIVQ